MKKIIPLVAAIAVTTNVFAFDYAIWQSNNQAFLDGIFTYDSLHYGNSRPADAGAPIYNANIDRQGATFGVTKTFSNFYTQLALNVNGGSVDYSDSMLNAALSDGNIFDLSVNARLGYTFYAPCRLAFTPYLTGGYLNEQLNTGGFSGGYFYNGATLDTHTFYYGIGLLNQWAPTSNWILSLNLLLGRQWNPNISGNVNNFNNQPTAVTTFQHWDVDPLDIWEIGLTSDYVAPYGIHVRAGVAYGQHNLGGTNDSSSGSFPSLHDPYWLWTLGLGYALPNAPLYYYMLITDQSAIYAVNNQVSLHLGYIWEKFSDSTSFYEFDVNDGYPYAGIEFTKSMQQLYLHLSTKAGFAVSSAHRSQNTLFDGSGKLGYIFQTNSNTDVIPYVIVGYRRLFHNFAGSASNEGFENRISEAYYINGISETLQNGFYGLGVLGQWAATPGWVQFADVNIGRTFNGSMRSWEPVGLPVYASFTLSDNWYEMAALGLDYDLRNHWHLQTSVQFRNDHYSADGVNGLALSTLNDSARQVSLDFGIAYSFA